MIRMIQVLGTSSDSGKSTLSMALCYYYARNGYKVAPFKAINMSLNSISIGDGSEIARAQWLQAKACGTEPSKYMNPYLIKPEGMGRSQLIKLGTSLGSMNVEDYYSEIKKNGRKLIKKSLEFLAKDHDIIIAEGAGSAAEINMYGRDLANTFVSSIFNTPAVLISDIDRGGVFASLYGTVKLMPHSELVKYMIINRMRGNSTMLSSGITKLEKLTGKKVAGIIPYSSINLPGEDSLNYLSEKINNGKICIIKYPYMENYSDFDPLYIHGIGFKFIDKNNVNDLDQCDIIILPGSKLVEKDLEYIYEHGIAKKLLKFAHSKRIIGICGGYQMLGNRIRDAAGVESSGVELHGLGLLNVDTEYSNEKHREEVIYRLNSKIFGDNNVSKGYEIHYGNMVNNMETPLAFKGDIAEGSINGKIMGTNIHAILENENFLSNIAGIDVGSYEEKLMNNIEKTSRLFTGNINMELINRLIQ
ncbi:MAG: cobyric acid synthase [Ferroplasma sp.]